MAAQDYFVGVAQERFQRRRGTPFSPDSNREYQRHFLVETRDNEIGPLGVCYCPGIPVPWSIYQSGNGKEYDTLALAIRYEVEQLDEQDAFLWLVTITYSTEVPAGGEPEVIGTPVGAGGAGRRKPQGSMNKPEMEPPEIEWDEEVVQRPVRFDLDSKAITNSAGQPYNHVQEVAYNILTVTRNDIEYDPQRAAEFAFAVNSDPFLGYPPGAAQCMPFKAKVMHRGPTFYHRVTYRIRFAPMKNDFEFDDWQTNLLDQGTMELERDITSPNHLKLKPIRRGGVAISQPILLDGNGNPYPEDQPSEFLIPKTRVFRTRRSISFARLFTRGLQTALTGPGVKYWNLDG